jgi:hypothetical protein
VLTEIPNARQVQGEGFRRWFSDDDSDLIVWYNDNRKLEGFQLCYDKSRRDEHAITWTRKHGFKHNRIDDGETRPGGPKSTPVLVADGEFRSDAVAEAFRRKSASVEPGIAQFVYQALKSYPGTPE